MAKQHPGGGLCTPAVLKMLRAMADTCWETEDLDDPPEAVYESGQVWVRYETFHPATLNKALGLCAVRDVTEGTGALQRYLINDVGLAIINDPSQADEVCRLLAARTNMTVLNGKVVELQ